MEAQLQRQTQSELKPGIYRNVPFKTYRDWDAVNASSLEYLMLTPAHYQYFKENPEKDTASTLRGRRVHTAVFEPNKFAEDFIVKPEWDARTKEGKAIRDEFMIKAGNKEVVEQDELDLISKIAENVLAEDEFRSVMFSQGEAELSIVWEDFVTGLLCKARIDLYSLDYDSIIDLKTTADASPEAFSRAIANYGYHRQAAHYLDGMKAVGMPVEHYVLTAAETSAPFLVATRMLNEETIAHGRKQVRRLLNLYAECKKNNHWPGYESGKMIGVPSWELMKELPGKTMEEF